MSRPLLFLVMLLVALGMSDASAQTKKGSAPVRNPTAKDPSILVNVYMAGCSRRNSRVLSLPWPIFSPP